MELPCLLFVISVSINGCVGGNDGEGSKPKKLRVEEHNLFPAVISREKDGRTSKKDGTFKLNLFSVTDLESRREYQRLVKINTQAVAEKWNYTARRRAGPDPLSIPYIASLGLKVEATLIQFCVGAVVEVEYDLHIIVSSATCVHMISQAESKDNTKDHNFDIGGGICHHPYSSGLDRNIALFKVNWQVPPYLSLLQLPSENDTTVKGNVAWHIRYYEDRRHGVIPTESYIVPGEIDDSQKPNGDIFRVKINSNKRTIPARDLGGSPFYVQDAQGRLILKGIRTLLAGDYFTAIAPFADWIREKAREV